MSVARFVASWPLIAVALVLLVVMVAAMVAAEKVSGRSMDWLA